MMPEERLQKMEQELAETKAILLAKGHRLFEFVKAHPFWSLAISALVSLLLNILASVIYDTCLQGFLRAHGWVR